MPAEQQDVSAFVPEHEIFWMLVKRRKRPDVGHVYLAIQTAIGLGMPSVNVGALIGHMMPEDRRMMGRYCPNIGNEGLAFFSWLYEFELLDQGLSDYHHYLFRRRYDGRSVTAYLKTSSEVGTPRSQERFEKERRVLEKQRDAILVKHRWRSLSEVFTEVFPDAQVIELTAPHQNSQDNYKLRRAQLEAEERALEDHLRRIRDELGILPPAA